MKNITSLKANKNESPKTPGGISKSLLTPCRRLGLSRNWKKAGPSPFVSPLTSSNTIDKTNSIETKVEKKESRKRKSRNLDEELEDRGGESPKTPIAIDNGDINARSADKNTDIVGTPSRHVEIPRKKKSKTLLSAITEEDVVNNEHTVLQNEAQDDKNVVTNKENDVSNPATNLEKVEVATPVRKKSNSKSKKRLHANSHHKPSKEPLIAPTNIQRESDIAQETVIEEDKPNKVVQNPISPNELTKECIVVIQKKIFKIDKKSTTNPDKENLRKTEEKDVLAEENKKLPSQTLFDSDSDDLPLNQLNNKDKKPIVTEIITIDEDDDFTDTKKVKVPKQEDKNTSNGGLKSLSTKKKLSTNNKTTKAQKNTQKVVELKPSSQSSVDDDDFDFDNKKTILIRKTYDKVTKPLKAKSTGSITQKDIDDLKARIEMKKKLLLAKAMTEDTKELRDLIKKWQKGCQDALMELMELMKNKFPDKQNMAYSEMLQALKIPADLVGYDSDDDCFNTPDDASIILSKFKD